MRNRTFFIAFIILFLSACGQEGNEFVGEWYAEKVIPTTMRGIPDTVLKSSIVITRNKGDSFIISTGNSTIPAVLNDGGNLDTLGGSYAYVADTDKITDGLYIYDRQK